MKRLSLQWRITLLTALLIACACVCMNLLLYRTGATGMDALNGFMMQYQPGSEDPLTIEIPQEEMSSLLAHFSQEVYDAKVVFGRKGWCITAVVTILSAAIAYFVSGRALNRCSSLRSRRSGFDQDSIATVRLDEDTVQEFGQLSRSVNRMLDGLAQSFELQRQFAGTQPTSCAPHWLFCRRSWNCCRGAPQPWMPRLPGWSALCGSNWIA